MLVYNYNNHFWCNIDELDLKKKKKIEVNKINENIKKIMNHSLKIMKPEIMKFFFIGYISTTILIWMSMF